MIQKIDRKLQPEFKSIKSIEYLKADKISLKNGMSIYSINSGNNDVIKLDIIFPAGIWYQNKSLISTFTSIMLLEGTKNNSSQQIAEKLDYMGSYIYPYIEKDIAGISLYCLTKHFEQTILLLTDILSAPIFLQSELDIHAKNKKQQFLINSEKVKIQSLRLFNKTLFGEHHPYGRSANEHDFDKISRNQLVDFYKKFYVLEKSQIIISGRIDNTIISILDKHIGSLPIEENGESLNLSYKIKTSSEKIVRFRKDDSVQSSIRLGKIMFNKLHPDYSGMQMLNLVFGGYFGSRLMNNIREDKGYTYGIHSSLVSLQNAGFFIISTEAGNEYTNRILNEIQKEIKTLQTELISEEEILRVRNYFLGEMVRGFDGPFEMADSFKSILLYGLDYNYFDEFFDTINTISADRLRDLAIKYLDYDSLKVIIAGNTEL